MIKNFVTTYVMLVDDIDTTKFFLCKNGYPTIAEKREAYETVWGVPTHEEERASDETVDQYVTVRECLNFGTPVTIVDGSDREENMVTKTEAQAAVADFINTIIYNDGRQSITTSDGTRLSMKMDDNCAIAVTVDGDFETEFCFRIDIVED